VLPLLLFIFLPPCIRRRLPLREMFDGEAALESVLAYAAEVTGVRPA
jgi:hypothetical protein